MKKKKPSFNHRKRVKALRSKRSPQKARAAKASDTARKVVTNEFAPSGRKSGLSAKDQLILANPAFQKLRSNWESFETLQRADLVNQLFIELPKNLTRRVAELLGKDDGTIRHLKDIGNLSPADKEEIRLGKLSIKAALKNSKTSSMEKMSESSNHRASPTPSHAEKEPTAPEQVKKLQPTPEAQTSNVGQARPAGKPSEATSPAEKPKEPMVANATSALKVLPSQPDLARPSSQGGDAQKTSSQHTTEQTPAQPATSGALAKEAGPNTPAASQASELPSAQDASGKESAAEPRRIPWYEYAAPGHTPLSRDHSGQWLRYKEMAKRLIALLPPERRKEAEDELANVIEPEPPKGTEPPRPFTIDDMRYRGDSTLKTKATAGAITNKSKAG
jgi:hypothetical protein